MEADELLALARHRTSALVNTLSALTQYRKAILLTCPCGREVEYRWGTLCCRYQWSAAVRPEPGGAASPSRVTSVTGPLGEPERENAYRRGVGVT